MMSLVCRACLEVVNERSRYVALDTEQLSEDVDVKTKLETCVPELRLDRVKNAIICSSCLEALNTAFTFKSKCTDVEVKVSRYISQAGVDTINLDVPTKCLIENMAIDDHVNLFLPSNNSIKCLVCQQWFDTVELFKKHVSTHMKNLKLQCCKCDFETNSQLHLNDHLKTHDSVVVYQCHACEYTSRSKTAYLSHRAMHSVEKLHQCSACDFKTTVAFNFRRHLKTHCHKQLFRCDQCSFTTPSSLSYEMHAKTHDSADEDLLCEFCAYKTSKKSTLRKHVWKRHGNGYKDSYTLSLTDVASVLQNGSVEDVVDVEVVESEYVVTADDVVSALRQSNATVLVHEFDEYPCPICKTSFGDKAQLNLHMSEHRERAHRYNCDRCDFSDNKLRSFKIHMVEHKGGTIYSCDKCSYRTVHNTYYKKHLQTHEKTCKKCSFKAFSQIELDKHLTTHDVASSTLKCAECPYEASSEDTMKDHLDMHVVSSEFINSTLHQHLLPLEL